MVLNLNAEVIIFFDEWPYGKNKSWVTLELQSPIATGSIAFVKGDRQYYVICGIVLSDNPFRIAKGKECKFHFPKVAFTRELNRHLELSRPPSRGDNITLTMRRENKHVIIMKDVAYTPFKE